MANSFLTKVKRKTAEAEAEIAMLEDKVAAQERLDKAKAKYAELKAKLDKAEPEIPICKKIYILSPINETDGKVFAWPNFASQDWEKYYYYSEFV